MQPQDKGHILITEDRDSLRRLMQRALEGESYRVTTCRDVAESRTALRRERLDLVLTDLMLPDGTGLEVLTASRESQPDAPVVVLTAFGTVTKAVEAMKRGATDFLEKPVELDDLLSLVEGLLGEGGETPVFQAPGAPAIVGRHPKITASLRLLRKVAPMESTVLITGESGTGKELFARSVHGLSPRKDGPFVAVNCAAIPVSLMENELFGHEKGAFTGATKRQAGRFELARGGTLFLDEIGELDPGVQGKVLRVLEERIFERVGGGRPLKADVRIVAATNRDLQAMSRAGTFRQDLYYRLDVFPIELPPLRDRASDIPHLARHLTQNIAQRLGVPTPQADEETLELLARQEWPGNVRQLANLLERAVILADDGRLDVAELQTLLEPGRERTVPTSDDPGETEWPERERLKDVRRRTDGDKKAAAEALKMSYRTLQRKIRQHDLEGFPKYRD